MGVKLTHVSIGGILIVLISVLLSLNGGMSRSRATEPVPAIVLDRTIHFLSADGSEVSAGPGVFTVTGLSESQLQLLEKDKEPLSIPASSAQHEEAIETVEAIIVTDAQNPDLVHVVLLQPEGRALDAVGSVSGVQSRAPAQPLSAAQLRGARDTTPPSGYVTTPKAGSVVKGTMLIDVQAKDNVGVQNVQILVDGSPAFCSLEKNAPYTCNWDTRKVKDGAHTLSAIIRDTANNAVTTAAVAIQVNNGSGTLPPPTSGSISGYVTTPQAGTSVKGTVLIDVSAKSTVAIQDVQILVDGNPVYCTLEKNAPYTCNWDTKKVTDGVHQLSAIIRDSANKTMTTAAVAVTVQNLVATAPPISGPPGTFLIEKNKVNGAQCNISNECQSGLCSPFAPDGKSYCLDKSMNCARPNAAGARAGDRLAAGSNVYQCANPGGSQSATWIKLSSGSPGSSAMGILPTIAQCPSLPNYPVSTGYGEAKDCSKTDFFSNFDCQRIREQEMVAARPVQLELDKSANIARQTKQKMPQEIYDLLRCFYEPGMIDEVYFSTQYDPNGRKVMEDSAIVGAIAGFAVFGFMGPLGIIVGGVAGGLSANVGWQDIALMEGMAAIVVNPDIIVFKDTPWSINPTTGAKYYTASQIVLWAHELEHIRQYRQLGVRGFAGMYTHVGGTVEFDAERKELQVCDYLASQKNTPVTVETCRDKRKRNYESKKHLHPLPSDLGPYLPNGVRCTEGSSCYTGQCYPFYPHANGYCKSWAMNCPLDGNREGAPYGARLNVNGSVYTCSAPDGSGYNAWLPPGRANGISCSEDANCQSRVCSPDAWGNKHCTTNSTTCAGPNVPGTPVGGITGKLINPGLSGHTYDYKCEYIAAEGRARWIAQVGPKANGQESLQFGKDCQTNFSGQYADGKHYCMASDKHCSMPGSDGVYGNTNPPTCTIVNGQNYKCLRYGGWQRLGCTP